MLRKHEIEEVEEKILKKIKKYIYIYIYKPSLCEEIVEVRLKWGDLGDFLFQVDLTGGYYDAGDNVKFGFPMAFSITLLSWSAVEFSPNLQKVGQLSNTLNAIRWGTDYLLKAHTGPTELWVQVSS